MRIPVDSYQRDAEPVAHGRVRKGLFTERGIFVHSESLHAHFGESVDEGTEIFCGVGHTAHHAIALVAGVIAEAFDVLTGHEVSGEHLAEHFKGGFEFFGNDIVGAKRVERPHLGDKARTGDDGDLGIGSTGLDHSPRAPF